MKLTKQQREQRDELVQQLKAKYAELQAAIAKYNGEVELLKAPVEAAVSDYNDVVEEAKEFCDEIAEAAQEEIDAKSDRWRDSDKGQEASEWLEAWESFSDDEVSPDWPDELGDSEPSHADDLASLPVD
jgi:hypothetical protein